MAPNRVVIVGAGQAGFQVAASLRQDGFDGEVILIGDEAGLPYQRPPLSKAYLKGAVGIDSLEFRPQAFFAEHRVELVHGRAAAIDRTNRRVTLEDGRALGYDHLVLATGAHNRVLPVPGADLDGVCGLRGIADADRLRRRLGEVRRVVVAGAGFIGLEFAAVAAGLGLDVHVLEMAERPMARAVSRPMSEAFAKAHRRWGVKLDLGQGLSRIEGRDGRVAAVETTAGRRVEADLVVFGIGVIPNMRLAQEAGLATGNGIEVDAHLLTSDPAISAAGDVAQFPSVQAGRDVRLESVQNAVDHARTIAARLMGHAVPYAAIPWFWSDQGDLKLQIAGLMMGQDAEIVVGDVEKPAFSVLGFREGTLIAVESVNRASDHMAARRLLGSHSTLSPQEAETPNFDLKAWAVAQGRPPRS